MLGEGNFLEELVGEEGRQLLKHGLLLLGFHFELYFPDKFEEVVDAPADVPGDLLELHEVVEGDDVLLVEDAALGVGVVDLDDHLGRVRRQQHEQHHREDPVQLLTPRLTIYHGLRAKGPGASVDSVPDANACPYTYWKYQGPSIRL